jgi:hypothetical protein
MSRTTDVDWVVIGSGFGGSVAALRLAAASSATPTFIAPLARGQPLVVVQQRSSGPAVWHSRDG